MRIALAIVVPLAAALLQGAVAGLITIGGAFPNLPVLVAASWAVATGAGEAVRLQPEAGRILRGLQRALAEASVDLGRLTSEALRSAIRSLAQPVERSLLELGDGRAAPGGSGVEADLRTALARILGDPGADVLPDNLKELAGQALARVEARQALNVLAMAHGQLLLEVAVRGPRGWEPAAILVEDEESAGRGEAHERVTHLTLQLQPDALGALRVVVRLKGDEVSCYLACSDPHVAEFAGARLAELRSGLTSRGLRVGAVQALALPGAEAVGPLRPSRLLAWPLLDALL